MASNSPRIRATAMLRLLGGLGLGLFLVYALARPEATRAGEVISPSTSTPSRNLRRAGSAGCDRTSTRYSFSMPYRGCVSLNVRSPSLVINSKPVLSASNLPTG